MTTHETLSGIIPDSWTTRRIILGTLVLLLVALSFLMLYRFRLVVVTIFSGIVISIAIAPGVEWLKQHGLPQTLSIILRRRFSSLLVVIVVLVLADQFGLVGILIAPPIAAVIQIFASQMFRATIQATMPQLTQPVIGLEERLEAVQSLLATQTEAPSSEITTLVERLAQLLARATRG